jgi:hypothetical protein
MRASLAFGAWVFVHPLNFADRGRYYLADFMCIFGTFSEELDWERACILLRGLHCCPSIGQPRLFDDNRWLPH